MALASMRLATADGQSLDAQLARPEDRARTAVVVAHPHPQHGGDMHNPVVDSLYQTLPDSGHAVLRFSFRGVGRSTGTYDNGRGEVLDVLAALDGLAAAMPAGTPLILAGYSFGSMMVLAVDDERVAGWAAIAPPLLAMDATKIAPVTADPRPKLVLAPDRDHFTPVDVARTTVGAWTSATFETIPGADHFLAGSTTTVAERVARFCALLAIT